tara:strand:+ start:315 stop:704 length:390 start_codon:yes stop_codon:yes gene_type:complete
MDDNNSSTPITSLNNDNNKEINDIVNKIERDNDAPKSQPQKVVNNEEIQNQNVEEEYEYSMYDMIYNEISYPILVAVIFVLLSLTQLDDLLCLYIKFICNDSGEMNFLGVILKSVLAAILFYIFGKYVV